MTKENDEIEELVIQLRGKLQRHLYHNRVIEAWAFDILDTLHRFKNELIR